MITRFGLIRHAQTVWNREKKIQGVSDSPLTAEGELQASRWGKVLDQLPWNRLLASDTGRALATADIINGYLKLPLIPDPSLREQDWGDWVGKTVSQIKIEQPLMLREQENAGWDFCPPGGEDRKSVLARCQRALQDAAARWPGDVFLVVTHEGVIKSLVYHLSGRKFLPTEPPILKSFYLHRLAYDGDGLRLEEINALELGSSQPG